MIVLLDNGQDLDVCAGELGCEVGQLLTPLTRYRLRDPSRPWAIDNGAFANFQAKAFLSLLDREKHHQQRCLFVTVPDIVGSAIRTLEVFNHWRPKLMGWKLALACQDGQEHHPIPWSLIDAVFIGGSTNWKMSDHAVQIIKAAQAIGKHTHVGRVNHAERFSHFEKLRVDTIDGTGLARYSHMREAIANRDQQRRLDFDAAVQGDDDLPTMRRLVYIPADESEPKAVLPSMLRQAGEIELAQEPAEAPRDGNSAN